MAASFSVVELLRSWWHPSRVRGQTSHHPVPTLGVQGLPEGVGRLPSASPVCLMTQDEASAQVWEPLLLQELLGHGPVLLLVASPQEADALWCHSALREAYASGRLRVAVLPPAKQVRLRRDGWERWAREVQRAGPGSVCMLDARALLVGASLAELRHLGTALRRFARQHGWPTVWMLPLARAGVGPQPAEGAQIAAAARSCSLGMDYVATLGHEAGQPLLLLHSWDGPQGALFQMRYHLHQEGLALTYSGSCAHGEVPILVQAPDAEMVYTTSACVAPPVVVPQDWVVLPDWDALEQAVQQAVGATVLLDVGPPSQFDALCALVYRLRSSLPASIKIIVRETTGKLRANSEQALLHLGVSAVAYRELGFARLLRLIASCRSLVHTQHAEESLEQALATFLPVAARGYQAPVVFEALAREMLGRGTNVGLTHTLVHLQLLPQVAHLDALQACRTLRDGDLVTADAQGILVFLFACSAADVAHALMNMFTLPIDQLFAAQVVDSSEVGIATLLRQLRDQASRLPDYTAALQPLEHASDTGAAQAQPASLKAKFDAKNSMVLLPSASLPTAQAVHLPVQTVHACPIGRRVAHQPTGASV